MDRCVHGFEVKIHDEKILVRSDDMQTGKLLAFIFGEQGHVVQTDQRTGTDGWRLYSFASENMSDLFTENNGQAEAAELGLSSYWRPDFEAAHINAAPTGAIVRHFAPFCGATLLIPQQKTLIYIRPGGSTAFVPQLEHLVGYLLRIACWRKGFVDLHAAMIRFRGKGIAIVGPKNAGKTSFAMHLLNQGAEMLGSDMGVVAQGSDGTLRALAIPHMCRVTRETIQDNFFLKNVVTSQFDGNVDYMSGPLFSHGKFELFAPVLNQLYDRQVNISSMRLDTLLFPDFSVHNQTQEITPIPASDANRLLLDSIIHDRPLADWLPFEEVLTRKDREAPILAKLRNFTPTAFKIRFGQEPTLNWDKIVETLDSA